MKSRSKEKFIYRAINPVSIILLVVLIVIVIVYFVYITYIEEESSLSDKGVVLFLIFMFLLIATLSESYETNLLVVYGSYIRSKTILTTQKENNFSDPTDILRFEDIEYVRYHKKISTSYLEIRDKNGLDYYFGKGINLEKLAPILKRLLPDKFEEVRE